MHPANRPSYRKVQCACGCTLHMTARHVEHAGVPTCGCGQRMRIVTAQHRASSKPARRSKRTITHPPAAPVKAKPARGRSAKRPVSPSVAALLKIKFPSRASDPGWQLAEWREATGRTDRNDRPGTVEVYLKHDGNRIVDEKAARAYLKEITPQLAAREAVPA